MGAAGIALGVLCCLAALFTCLTRGNRRDHDDTLLAFALTWLWAAAIAMQMITSEMGYLDGRMARFEAGAVFDLLMGMMIVSRIRNRAAGWKWSMASLNAVALSVDVLFLLSDRTREAGNTCKLALNLIFIAQLACVCWPGVTDAVRRDRVRLLHRLSAGHPERGGAKR